MFTVAGVIIQSASPANDLQVGYRGDGDLTGGPLPASVEKTLLLLEPLPCNLAAETALQPLIWCFSREYSQAYSSPEECFFRRRWHCRKSQGDHKHLKSIWGFDYNFTNYTFRNKNLTCLKITYIYYQLQFQNTVRPQGFPYALCKTGSGGDASRAPRSPVVPSRAMTPDSQYNEISITIV